MRHQDGVSSAAFGPDGKRAILGRDKTIKLWDIESCLEIDSTVIDGVSSRLAVHGDLVLVGNRNSTITVYRVN